MVNSSWYRSTGQTDVGAAVPPERAAPLPLTAPGTRSVAVAPAFALLAAWLTRCLEFGIEVSSQPFHGAVLGDPDPRFGTAHQLAHLASAHSTDRPDRYDAEPLCDDARSPGDGRRRTTTTGTRPRHPGTGGWLPLQRARPRRRCRPPPCARGIGGTAGASVRRRGAAGRPLGRRRTGSRPARSRSLPWRLCPPDGDCRCDGTDVRCPGRWSTRYGRP